MFLDRPVDKLKVLFCSSTDALWGYNDTVYFVSLSDLHVICMLHCVFAFGVCALNTHLQIIRWCILRTWCVLNEVSYAHKSCIYLKKCQNSKIVFSDFPESFVILLLDLMHHYFWVQLCCNDSVLLWNYIIGAS